MEYFYINSKRSCISKVYIIKKVIYISITYISLDHRHKDD